MPHRPRIKLAGIPQHIVQRGINRAEATQIFGCGRRLRYEIPPQELSLLRE
jgi:hypothetical protein